MSRFSALVAGTALAATALITTPAQAAPVPIATSVPYALNVDGQTEGLSFTATEANPTHDYRVSQHDVGRTALHAGWGAQLSAPQGSLDSDLRAIASVKPTYTQAHAGVSLHLTDARGPFLYFGTYSGSQSCSRDGGPDWAGGSSGLRLAVRNAHEVLSEVESTATGWSSQIWRVDAGDQATPDGHQRITNVTVTKLKVADLAAYGDLFPGAYRLTGGHKVTVTQQLDANSPVKTYDFVVGAHACNG
jgi:hypothetical protein